MGHVLDDEGGRRVDLVFVVGFLHPGQDLGLQRVVMKAGLEGLVVDADAGADLFQGRHRVGLGQ